LPAGAAPAGAGAQAGAGSPGAAPAPETAAQTLASVGPAMVAAVMPMQSSEMAPTAAVLKTIQDRQAEYTALMAKWNALKLKLKAS